MALSVYMKPWMKRKIFKHLSRLWSILLTLFKKKSFFDVGHFLKSLLNLLQYCFCFMNFFWLWGMWDLSFPTRDQACASYIGRQSLNHWTTRKVPPLTLHIAFQRDQFLEAAPFFLLYREPVYTLPGLWYYDPHLRAKFHLLFGRSVFEARYSCTLVLSESMDSNLSLKYFFFFIGHKCVCSVLSL